MISLGDIKERAPLAYWKGKVLVSREKHMLYTGAYGGYKKRRNISKTVGKRKHIFFFPISSSSNIYWKQNFVLCLFPDKGLPLPRRYTVVHLSPAFASWGFGPDQNGLQDAFNEYFLYIYITDLQLSWSARTSLPPCLAPLQGWRPPTAAIICSPPALRVKHSWSRAPKFKWNMRWRSPARLRYFRMRLELWTQIWTWILGLDPRVWAGPHL